MIFSKIAIASDHRGFELKSDIIAFLDDLGIEVFDFGTNSSDVSVDYPDYAKKVSEYVTNSQDTAGILVCYSGVGMSIAANKFQRIRAVLCYSNEIAKLSREHNNANVLCLGAGFLDFADVKIIINTFLNTDFDERHINRIEKIYNLF